MNAENDTSNAPVTRHAQALSASEAGLMSRPDRPTKYGILPEAIRHGVLPHAAISEATTVAHRNGLPDGLFKKFQQAAINGKVEAESSGRTDEMRARRTLESLRARHGANAEQMLTKFESVAAPLRESPAFAHIVKISKHDRPLIEACAAYWDFMQRKKGA
jgi:hypothetical protein